MNEQKREVERWQWHKGFECVVEILSAGHFPTTVMVKLPDEREVETDLEQLVKKGNDYVGG